VLRLKSKSRYVESRTRFYVLQASFHQCKNLEYIGATPQPEMPDMPSRFQDWTRVFTKISTRCPQEFGLTLRFCYIFQTEQVIGTKNIKELHHVIRIISSKTGPCFLRVAMHCISELTTPLASKVDGLNVSQFNHATDLMFS